MIVKTLKWVGGINGYLEIIDQRKLPGEFKLLRCTNVKQLYDAIKTLAVRGAPAIGVAGGYGAVLAIKDSHRRWSRRPRRDRPSTLRFAGAGRERNKISSVVAAVKFLKKDCEYLASSRPTAVNLRWAIERVIGFAENWISENQGIRGQEIRVSGNQAAGNQIIRKSGKQGGTVAGLRKAVLAEANAIFEEDVRMCRAIGKNGAKFIPRAGSTQRRGQDARDTFTILTHCNAGALATAGQGTALSVLYEAKKQGKRFKVIADESRPLLQGSRLTAWELKQAGIDVTVICDDMAGVLMAQGKIDMVIVGADRIAANGDTANKIGTYSLSVLAKAHPPRRTATGEISPLGSKAARPAARADKIPFYIAAPSSTFDLNTKSGKDIPIEQRPADEVRFCGGFNPSTRPRLAQGRQIAPNGVKFYNPAFDVTPAKNITAIITERGVIEKPNARKIAKHFANKKSA